MELHRNFDFNKSESRYAFSPFSTTKNDFSRGFA